MYLATVVIQWRFQNFHLSLNHNTVSSQIKKKKKYNSENIYLETERKTSVFSFCFSKSN